MFVLEGSAMRDWEGASETLMTEAVAKTISGKVGFGAGEKDL
jgi:hypothetical protein